MFENVQYINTNGETYIINGDSPDFVEDLGHKILFSIEKPEAKLSFSYSISISHQLWKLHWNVKEESQPEIETIKNLLLEKVKRLLDSGLEEYVDMTLTPLNTPKTITEAFEKLKQTN